MLRIYLTNLGKYNEGELVGEWVELPIEKEELKNVFKRIGISNKADENGRYYEEFFITDYESDFNYKVGEYDNIEELNEIAESFNNLDDTEKEVFKIMIEDGYNTEEALESINSGNYRIYYDCENMEDVAYQVVEECGYLQNVSENVARYFDYEAFGRDLGIEGKFFSIENGMVEIY